MSSAQKPEKALELFYSYAHRDERWRKRLEVHLSNLRRQGFITEWHDRDISAGTAWASEVDTHLNTADIILLLVSPDFISTEYCYSVEMTRAIERYESGEACVIPIILRPTDYRGAPFEHLLALPSDAKPVTKWANPDEALLDIARGIRETIEKLSPQLSSTHPLAIPDTLSGQKRAIPAPPIWNVPCRRNPFFIGRESLLSALHEHFTGRKTAPFTQMLAVYGLGGIGKTQVAVEYAYRHKQEYQAVLWVRAAAYDTLVSDYVTIAYQLHLSAKEGEEDQNRLVEAVKQWLTSHEDWLLILDNVDDLDMITNFLPIGENGHILLTTWDSAAGVLAPAIEVQPLELDDGISLLLRHAHGLASSVLQAQTTPNDWNAAARIVQEMGSLPLALDQAGAYIEQTRCGLAQYLKLYQQHRTELLKWKRPVSPGYSKTVATTWALAFEEVEQRNRAAADLLRLCAFLSPDSIPEDLLTLGASELGPELQPAVEDAFLFNEAIGVLLSFSLIRRLEDTKSLTIHRLVQLVICDRMDHLQQVQWAERTVHLVNAAFPEVRFETQEQCKRFLPHAFACLDLVDQHDFHFSAAARLMNRAGRYLYNHARNSEAERLLRRALSIEEQQSPPEQQEIASILNSLANLCRDQDKYAEAEQLYQRALAIREQVLGPAHLETATTLSNLASLHRDQDNYAQAEQLYLQALGVKEQSLGAKHPEVAYILNNLALLYWIMARYGEVELLLQRALAIEESAFPPGHPSIAITLDSMASLYRELGRYAEAERLYRRALGIEEAVFPAEHPRTAITLNNLATLYREQGHYAEAEQLYRRALDIRKQVRGAAHPETANTFDELATLYRKQGRYVEAEALHQKALAIFEQAQGYDHPEIAITLSNLATLCRELGRYDEAERLYQQVLTIRERVLGPKHPATADTLNDLALLYQAQGQYEVAGPLCQRALDIYKQALPADHPVVALVLENYASLLKQMNRPEEGS